MNPCKQFDRTLKKENGVATMETVIVLPLLLLLFLGISEMGYMLCKQIEISKITYEGARYAASLPGLDAGDLTVYKTRVLERMSQLYSFYGMNEDESAANVEYVNIDGNMYIRVTLSSTYKPITPLLSEFTNINSQANAPYLYPI